jgi:hypothetical protein
MDGEDGHIVLNELYIAVIVEWLALLSTIIAIYGSIMHDRGGRPAIS